MEHERKTSFDRFGDDCEDLCGGDDDNLAMAAGAGILVIVILIGVATWLFYKATS